MSIVTLETNEPVPEKDGFYLFSPKQRFTIDPGRRWTVPSGWKITEPGVFHAEICYAFSLKGIILLGHNLHEQSGMEIFWVIQNINEPDPAGNPLAVFGQSRRISVLEHEFLVKVTKIK